MRQQLKRKYRQKISQANHRKGEIKMTENNKEQVLKKDISMEMAEEVVGGGKEFLGGGDFGVGETELCGGGDFGGFNSNGGGSKPAGAGGGSKPAAPGGSTHTKTDNIDNTNIGGKQKIGNQGRNNRIDGTVNF